MKDGMRTKHDRGKKLDLDEAIHSLRAGRVVAYPTETFFGLGVDAMNAEAVGLLRNLKQRGKKPISVIIAVRDMLTSIAHPLDAVGEKLADTFWPGPLTLVLPAKEIVPFNLRAGGLSVGVRVSSHIVAAALSNGISGPITSTSCNAAQMPEPTRPEQVTAELMAAIAGYVEGVAPGGHGSTIVDLTEEIPTVLRQGAISLEKLKTVVPRIKAR